MPLIKSKSKQAVGENISTEMHAGKPQKQSIAIALSVQRAAKHKPKKMAEGGMAMMKEGEAEMGPMNPKLAESHKMPDHEEHYASIADAILAKKKMAEGGQVDLEENAEEEGSSPYDTMNADATDTATGIPDDLSPQPEDSNEHSEEIEEDKHDMISAIRGKLKAKRS